MPNQRILIVDDEPNVRQFLRLSLEAEGFTALEASTAEEALTLVHTADPALMVLDLGLPDIDGQQVILDVRLSSTLPILVLSGRIEDSQKIAALDHGADDYITKPFATQELVARVRAALEQQNVRRTGGARVSIATGDLNIFLDQRVVMQNHKALALDDEEYALLRLLALHGGRVLTMGRIERALWGKSDQRHNLQKRISGLRRKIENEPAFPRYIVTEPAVGYRLEMLPAEKRA